MSIHGQSGTSFSTQDIYNAIDHHGLSFNKIQEHISSTITRRTLTKGERSRISIVVKQEMGKKKEELVYETLVPSDILILMAYSTDYTIGRMCEKVNRSYAMRHGYEFRCDVLPYEDMLKAIEPRTHCTWYKVILINSVLNSTADEKRFKFVFWIDADAIIVDFEAKIEDIIFRHQIHDDHAGLDAASTRARSVYSQPMVAPDLIVSRDMTEQSSCPLNCGVILIRISDWSKELWEDVWSHPSSQKYHDVYYYEQSALIKCLRSRNLIMESFSLNSSPVGSSAQAGCIEKQPTAEVVLIPRENSITEVQPTGTSRVCILPCCDLNSNKICAIKYCEVTLRRDDKLSAMYSACQEGRHTCAQFIFHAVGKWNKLVILRHVVILYSLLTEAELDALPFHFKMLRGRCGGVVATSLESSQPV